MAYTLNTSHPLYANLIELFGVKDGALVSHKIARTFTKHADASFGTGTYGEHFTSLNGGYTAKGASFTPALAVNTLTTPTYTVIAVFNAFGTSSSGHSVTLARAAGGSAVRSPGKDASGNLTGYRLTGSPVGTGAKMLTYCRLGETAAKLYNNKTLDNNGTELGSDYNDPSTVADYLLGWDGQAATAASLVWLAVVSGEVTAEQISDLYDSLGADNAFGLVESSGGTDATAPATTVTGTGSISAGVATGGSGSTGSFTFPAGENNTHSGPMDGVAVNWAWHSGGAVGSATTITNGSGTMTTAGMTITGLPLGPGYVLFKSADGMVVGYREGTVS